MDVNFSKFNILFPKSIYRKIRPDSKAPLNSAVFSYKQIEDYDGRVGWVVSDGYIVVDIDDADVAARVEEWLDDIKSKYILFKTVRGKHFIFRENAVRRSKNTSHTLCMLGVDVDYRVAGKGYIVLPYNDSERSWVSMPNEVDTLPIALTPLQNATKLEPNLVGLSEGDGRNDAIFAWKGVIQNEPGITSDDKVDVIHIINKYIFDTPVDEGELSKTILRPSETEKMAKIDDVKTSVQSKKPISQIELDIADQMMEENVFRVMNWQQLYVYTGRYYKLMSDREVEVIIATKYDPLLRDASRKEIIAKLKLFAKTVDEDNQFWSYISFNNCVLDIATGETHEPSEDLFVTTAVNRDYVIDPERSEAIETFLAHCSSNDMQKRKLILEMIGDCFLQRAVFQKMFLIYGEGGTGKSTLLRLITDLVGPNNATYLSTKDLESTFLPAELYGKLVNVGDDIPFLKISDSSQIKKLVSGEVIMVQRKFSQPLKMINFATLIFTANQLPNSLDRTSGFMRRLCLIDMNVRITDPRAFFAKSFTNDDLEYLMFIALSAIRDALRRGELTQSYVVDKNLDAYKKTQSSLSEFIDDNEITKEYLLGKSTSEIYAEYSHYCSENGMKPLGKHYLVADLCGLYYITTIKAKDDMDNLAVRFTYVTDKTN